MVEKIICAVLWMITSCLAFFEYVDDCRSINWSGRIIAMVVFLIGGPIFAANQVLVFILDTIFPEGWDNDDNDDNYRR